MELLSKSLNRLLNVVRNSSKDHNHHKLSKAPYKPKHPKQLRSLNLILTHLQMTRTMKDQRKRPLLQKAVTHRLAQSSPVARVAMIAIVKNIRMKMTADKDLRQKVSL